MFSYRGSARHLARSCVKFVPAGRSVRLLRNDKAFDIHLEAAVI